MFGIKTIGNILSNLNTTLSKVNQTVHGSTDAAAKTTEHLRSGASGIMTAKGVKDCVVAYQCNDYICLTISGIGTVADFGNHICGNVPVLKKFTPINTYLSIGCKSFVHLCRTGNITFSCND
jgi:hypothetical protein